ncbi:methionine--tRNA ligase [Nanoarchaeota archaeon]
MAKITKITPIESAKRIIVTSALPYANGPIHIGHLVEYIQTDIFVRFLKLIGKNACYCCADDTHGTPIQIKSEELKIKPEELIAKYHKEHQEDFAKFHIKFDSFYSTNSDENKHFAEKIFNKLNEKGHIYQKEMELTYCDNCKKFLPDRYVKGNCPFCGAEEQYGDVCEKCHKTYEPVNLVEPFCIICKNKPIIKKSNHYFFKLSQFCEFLTEFLNHRPIQEEVKHFVQNWITGEKENSKQVCNLQDWCISRDGPYFGFKIPGEENKYFYVWLDAPIGYISSFANYLGKGVEEAEKEWNSEDTHIIHVIGKDIIYFHFLFWPAMLHASEFKIPDNLAVHGFLTVNNEKMSKSRGTFLTAKEFANGITPEFLRFYFASSLSSNMTDIDLDLEDFKAKINNELVANIANFVYRTTSFLNKNLDGKITKFDEKELVVEIIEIKKLCNEIKDHYLNFEFKEALKKILEISSIGNKYFQDNEPWKVIKEDKKKAQEVLSFCCNIVKILSTVTSPIMPEFSNKLNKMLGIEQEIWEDIEFDFINKKINKAEILFNKIENELEVFGSKKDKENKDKEVKKKTEKNEKKKGKKQIKENKKEDKKASKESKQEKEEPFEDPFSLVDLKVAKIISVHDHPDAEKLYVIKISLGEELPGKQIVAGLKKHYKKEDLTGKKIVVVNNLVPTKLRGEESHGMLLVGESKDKKLELLDPGDAKTGAEVIAEGIEKNPDNTISFKEFTKLKLKVDKEIAKYNDKELKTDKGIIKCKGIEKGEIG